MRAALFLLIAVAVAGVAALLLGSSKGDGTPQHPPPAKITVIAAAGLLRAGTLIRPEDLEAFDIAADQAPKTARPDSQAARADLLGAMVRHTLAPHQPVLAADVLRPGDHGFLAAVLAPGMRATSVGVDAVSGTAGLIWPGDHVDLILTQEISEQGIPPGQRVAGETVLSDVRVIAIDQQLVQGAMQSASSSPGTGVGIGEAQGSRTVTLEVLPDQAERVAVAARLGKLALAVRAADSAPDKSAVPPTTWGSDVSPALARLRAGADGHATGPALRVFEGRNEPKEYHF